jgi:hypothetical protein
LKRELARGLGRIGCGKLWMAVQKEEASKNRKYRRYRREARTGKSSPER